MCNQQKSSCPCYETNGNKFLPDLFHALFTSMLAAYGGNKSSHPCAPPCLLLQCWWVKAKSIHSAAQPTPSHTQLQRSNPGKYSLTRAVIFHKQTQKRSGLGKSLCYILHRSIETNLGQQPCKHRTAYRVNYSIHCCTNITFSNDFLTTQNQNSSSGCFTVLSEPLQSYNGFAHAEYLYSRDRSSSCT